MHRQRALLFGAALLGLAHALQPQVTAPPGPRFTGVPRKVAKRQENEDMDNIEIHQDYGAPIGVDTQYLTIEGSTTKWIGVNTDFLTEETRTGTVDDVETTTVVQSQLAVATATEASEGVEVGDVTILMPDSLQDELDALIKDAAASCAGAAKLRRRDSMSCMVNAIQGAAQNDEALGLINPSEWDGFALELAENAPEILGGAVQVLKTQAHKNKFAILVAAAATAGAWAGTEAVSEVSHKFVFGGGLFGHPADDSDGGDDEDEDEPTCDPSAEVDENSPACDDEDCEGEDEVCQVDGDKKDCPCVLWTEHMFEGFFDKEWSDAQQKIIQELEEELGDVIPPQCSRNTYGDRFDGEPAAEPSAFCHCKSADSEGSSTNGNYPTMSGEGDDACTYTTMPTETISISLRPKETGVTSCRIESSHSIMEPFCTCNDDRMHAPIATDYLGTETTVCPDATATMTEIDGGTPTGEPSCYPTHGAPHDNPELDELIKLCEAGDSEFAAVCQTKPDSTERISVNCPGKASNYELYLPLQNNDYHAWFEEADDAPEECNYLFDQGGSDNEDEVNAQVDALCIPAFQAIKDKCTWNGGEVKNVCGTFKYQSCPSGSICEPGNPG